MTKTNQQEQAQAEKLLDEAVAHVAESERRGTSRPYVLARLAREGRADMAALVESGDMSVRRALRHLQGASRA